MMFSGRKGSLKLLWDLLAFSIIVQHNQISQPLYVRYLKNTGLFNIGMWKTKAI